MTNPLPTGMQEPLGQREKLRRDIERMSKGGIIHQPHRNIVLAEYIHQLEKEHREMRMFLETTDTCLVEKNAFQVCQSCIARRKHILSSLTCKS